MKNINLLKIYVSVLLMTLSVSCSDSSSNFDRKVDLNFRNGETAITGQYIAGEKVGVWKKFYPSGELRLNLVHDNNGEEVSWDYYSPTGILLGSYSKVSEGSDYPQTYITEYYSLDGSLTEEDMLTIEREDDGEAYHYVESTVEKSFYPSGQLMREMKYYGDELVIDKWYDSLGRFQGEFVERSEGIEVDLTGN